MNDKNTTTWTVTLSQCPYCNKDLNISSLSTRSIKDSIGSVIVMSKIHLNKCRDDKAKQLANISIKEVTKKEKSELITFKRDKIYS
jgi:glutaredoxin